MSNKANVILPLAASVRTDDGIRTVSRGEEIPANTLSEERKRLTENGIIGTAAEAAALPPNVVTEPVERPTPRDQAQAAIKAREIAELREEQAQDAAAKEAELLAEQQDEHVPGPAPAGPTAPAANAANEDFDAFIAEANVDDVVAAVKAQPEGDQAEYAQTLLDAEKSVRDEPRKSLVEKLEALTDGDE